MDKDKDSLFSSLPAAPKSSPGPALPVPTKSSPWLLVALLVLVVVVGVGLAILAAPRRPPAKTPPTAETAPQEPLTPPDLNEEGTTTTASGLKYLDRKVGDGRTAKAGNTVSVHYTGTLVNGMKFDSSHDRDQPFNFSLGAGQVIRGWDEGIAGMKEGGKRRLIIPPELGYGAQGHGATIPPNSTLIFEVELIKVK